MLVLTRRQGQYVSVKLPSGEIITVHIVQAKNDQVRIGINAPRSIQVDRGEIVLEQALKKLKQEVGATCSDETFIEVWGNMPIPQLGRKTARELTMSNPLALEDVVNEIKRNFS